MNVKLYYLFSSIKSETEYDFTPTTYFEKGK